MNQEVANLRINYSKSELLEKDLKENPIKQFYAWFEEAKNSSIIEPNAMVLSTVRENRPKSRVVLLKGFDEKGFVFYSNYNSDKGQQLAENPFATLNFFWDQLQRQVRIEGKVKRLSAEESDKYFWSRPVDSQIGAWVSQQSEILDGRDTLEATQLALNKKFASTEQIPRPPHWGGYLLSADLIEFWQGRPSRLHDRIRYRLIDSDWSFDRLSP